MIDNLNSSMESLSFPFIVPQVDAIHSSYNDAVADFNALSVELHESYDTFVTEFVPLLHKAEALNARLRKLKADLHAKGLHKFPASSVRRK